MLMTCRHCRDLRDAFLDGELSQSQMAEMHAHLLQCPECQQHIELMRACGDVIRHDQRRPRLPVDFADRLMASLPAHRVGLSLRQNRWMRTKRWIEIGAIPAIAACLALMVMTSGHKPSPEIAMTPDPQGRVLGESMTVVDSFMEVRSSVNELGKINGACVQTIANMVNGIDTAATRDANSPQPDFVGELLHPLFDLFNPPIAPPVVSDDIERF